MTDMQISLPLLIVRLYILNLVINFSTHLWPVKWKCPRLYLCLAHSISSPSMLMQHMHQPITNDMIHFISSRDHIGSSILTSLALHRCIGPSVPSLAQALPSHAVARFKASDLPFTLATGSSSQVMSWSSPPWSHNSMSCLICNKLLHHHMCKLFNISKLFSPPWHMLLTHMYLWTNYLCISYKTQLVHLSCHSITKTKQRPFNWRPCPLPCAGLGSSSTSHWICRRPSQCNGRRGHQRAPLGRGAAGRGEF
jgi:hypothetical protein